MKIDLVTILEADEGAKTAYVQTNVRAHIGDPTKKGGNDRHEFSTAKDAEKPWKGDVRKSLEALYPGAEIHTEETLNADVIGPALVAKGTHVAYEGETMPIPKAEAERRETVKAEEAAAVERAEAAKKEAEKETITTDEVGDAGAVLGAE